MCIHGTDPAALAAMPAAQMLRAGEALA